MIDYDQLARLEPRWLSTSGPLTKKTQVAVLTCDFVRVHFSVVFAKRNAGVGSISSLKLMNFSGRGREEREGFFALFNTCDALY